MKKLTALFSGAALVCSLATAGTATAAGDGGEAYIYDLGTLTTTDPHAQALMDHLDATVPGWRETAARLRASSGTSHRVDEAVEAALNGPSAACVPGSIRDFFAQSVADVDPAVLFVLTSLGALEATRLDAWLFGTEGDPDYVLPGDPKALNKSFRKAEHFWPAQSDDIRALGLHGEMVVDHDRVVRLVEVALGMPPAAAEASAGAAIALVNSDPALAGGDNPVFTLNAYAPTDEDPYAPPYAADAGDAILIGEGIAQWFAAEGVDAEHLQIVMGHEYGHHVQYEIGLFDPVPPSPEENRRLELMADAFGAYFSAHRQGLNTRCGEAMEVRHQMMYEVGSCDTDDPDYHGTPEQRLAISDWAGDLAVDAQKQGHQVPVSDLVTLFDAELADLLTP